MAGTPPTVVRPLYTCTHSLLHSHRYRTQPIAVRPLYTRAHRSVHHTPVWYTCTQFTPLHAWKVYLHKSLVFTHIKYTGTVYSSSHLHSTLARRVYFTPVEYTCTQCSLHTRIVHLYTEFTSSHTCLTHLYTCSASFTVRACSSLAHSLLHYRPYVAHLRILCAL